jgi:AAA+ ATPase superfamily predicted ATPase
MAHTGGDRFVDRPEVLAALSGHLDAVVRSGTGRMLAVRGRRQVGKSTVVERFVERSGVPYVFATGVYQGSTVQQLDSATRAFADSRHPIQDAALVAESARGSWRDWLGRLVQAARFGPVIAVLDEFGWMTQADPTLEGVLQAIWDRTLEKLPVLIVLVGSDLAMMERIASYDRPLFGRLRQLAVPALNPAEVAGALSRRSAFEVFDAYLVTGGLPRLVAGLAGSGLTAQEYVRESLTDAFSPLVVSARVTLDAEFPDAGAAYQVLSAIGADATARTGFADAAAEVGTSGEPASASTATARALRLLTEVKGLVEREQPAWAPASSKLRRYRIVDPYLRFWFRFVERQVDTIARGRTDLAIGAFDRDWSSWRGRSVEPVVRDALFRLGASDARLAGVESVRPWWTRDGSVEVDVVAATSSATAVLGTIKWRETGAVTGHEMEDLRRHLDRVPRSADALLAAISPAGRAPRGADLVFSASDLLQAWR